MPEITPIWIDGWYDSQAQAASDMREGLDDALGRYVYPVQALTLDQIEEWLTGNKREIKRLNHISGPIQNLLIDDLLAQVQAWKADSQ
jgi:hypothetical protein